MLRIAIVILAATALCAEDAPRPLNPYIPADAIRIVDQRTLHATWPGMDREQVVELQLALQTIASALVPPAPPKPEPPKEEPKAEAKPQPAPDAKPVPPADKAKP